MRSKKVWRYYCDYCKKAGCNKHVIVHHEKYCTMNPNRQCRMCKLVEQEPKSVEELKQLLHVKIEEDEWGNESCLIDKEDLDVLRSATGNCPACMLAAFRQKGVQAYQFGFDFKEACKDFWIAYNDSQTEVVLMT